MKPVNFKGEDTVFAENQKEYIPLPAFVGNKYTNPDGNVVFCMSLSFKERVILLFTGKLWCNLLMFRDKEGKVNPLTPSYFSVKKSDVITIVK